MVTQTHYFVYFTVRSYGFDEKPNLYKKEKKERKCLGFFIYVTELARCLFGSVYDNEVCMEGVKRQKCNLNIIVVSST